MMRHPIPWPDYAAEQFGTRHWIVAPTLTAKMKRGGYNKAIPQARFRKICGEWVLGHPGVRAAHSLPKTVGARDWLINAAMLFARRDVGTSGVPGAVSTQDAAIALHRQLCGLAS